jgi:alanine dehydrogenase
MKLLKVGVIGKSRKENERRVAIHPDHIESIPSELRQHLVFESGYGRSFGVEDEFIAGLTAGAAKRDEIFKTCDVLIIPKPELEDYSAMKENQIHWGWAHVIQQKKLAQAAIDRRMTLITWESMNRWGANGDWLMHIFYKNNEIAGYAGVSHALGLTGLDGNYGRPGKVVVINFGSVSRGALYALQGHGFKNICVFTLDPPHLVGNQVAGPDYKQLITGKSGELFAVENDGSLSPFIEELKSADIIVNGILQNPNHPLMYMTKDDVNGLKKGTLIIDISCDEGMGFPFAKPTTFEEPTFKVSKIDYYAVDHTPSYLWNSATWEISKSLLPFLPVVMAGPDQWEKNETIRRAIEIRDGVIKNPQILSFQNRSKEYPHKIK